MLVADSHPRQRTGSFCILTKIKSATSRKDIARWSDSQFVLDLLEDLSRPM
jgi:hypothetical protein